MKKIIYCFAAMLILATVTFTLSSCSEENEEPFAYFTLGVGEVSISGNDQMIISDYMGQIEAAYYQAIGMKQGDNTLIFNNTDYKKKAAELKALFDNAKLPEAPQTGSKYSFTFRLWGTGKSGVVGLSGMDVVASKTFTNK